MIYKRFIKKLILAFDIMEERINEIGFKCLESRDAVRAFSATNNKKGLLKVIEAAGKKIDKKYLVEEAFDSYFDAENKFKFLKSFRKWYSDKGFEYVTPHIISFSNLCKHANMAHRIAGNYDIGIGIAKGGLFLTYLFDFFGLETRVIEAHAHKEDEPKTFKWVDRIDNLKIKDKKVILFEDDIVSGRTAIYVAEKLREYEPEQLDLALIHDPNDIMGDQFQRDADSKFKKEFPKARNPWDLKDQPESSARANEIYAEIPDLSDEKILKNYLKGYNHLHYSDKFDYSNLDWIKKIDEFIKNL